MHALRSAAFTAPANLGRICRRSMQVAILISSTLATSLLTQALADNSTLAHTTDVPKAATQQAAFTLVPALLVTAGRRATLWVVHTVQRLRKTWAQRPDGSLRAGPRLAKPQPVLHAAWVVGGELLGPDDGTPPAWAEGVPFNLRVSSTLQGTLTVHAINPDGIASAQPLWRADVQGSAPIDSPALRLQATKGVETVHITLHNAAGHLLAWQVLHLQHV